MNKKSRKNTSSGINIANGINQITNPYNTILTTNNTTGTINLNGVSTWNSTGYIQFDNTDQSVIDFFNFICELIGIDMEYDKFKKLSKEERMQYLRDSKIKEILK